ncbi:glycerophosphodiester phosphodiesterase family protein [Salinibacterium sp. ZJ450]|uniref:glycerophosphodiester phosphodiesterase n=1 Tax=Salinibacterium sp. ZJ450 TaxID=2708338 RepID=UPI00141F04F3|nr:glycerophosphodiester phosphodiesterase family protein [Salinibacterium sp. ZJ450]
MATSASSSLPRARRILPASAGVIALVLAVALNLPVGSVQAAGAFESLRAPGEAGFIAAHRGDRSAAPENTLPALQAALDAGMSFVETDVQLSKDGVPVLMHDATVDRTTNGSGRVADLTLAELQTLDAGGWFAPEFAGVPVPTLDEYLALLVTTEAMAIIELKGFWSETDVAAVSNLLYGYSLHSRAIIASFTLATVAHAREAAPAIPRIVLRRDLPADPVRFARFYDAIAVMTKAATIERRPELVETMHEAGVGILLYTLNTEQNWAEALAFGVDGIVTDAPSDLDSWLAATAPGT